MGKPRPAASACTAIRFPLSQKSRRGTRQWSRAGASECALLEWLDAGETTPCHTAEVQFSPGARRAIFGNHPPHRVPKGFGIVTSRNIRSTSASFRGLASMLFQPTGSSSGGRSCTAPAQSRPIAVSRSNASAECVLKRLRMRLTNPRAVRQQVVEVVLDLRSAQFEVRGKWQ